MEALQKVRCQACVDLNCKDMVLPMEIVRLEWKKEGKSLDVCINCFAYIQKKQLKEARLDEQIIRQSGYWDEGARAIDFKSFLEKWINKAKKEW